MRISGKHDMSNCLNGNSGNFGFLILDWVGPTAGLFSGNPKSKIANPKSLQEIC
jgi:hypothetical protein